MDTVFFDSGVDDDVRRQRLYRGELFVFSPKPSSIALIEFARAMIGDAFGSKDPLTAQYEMPVEEYVAIVAPLKPSFIHHPETMKLLRVVVEEFGCDLSDTYVDVPRLRMVTSDAYLTSGVGYAHHLHRDTWYSAPMAQLNWWLPIFDFESESSMAFHPRYWSEAVENGSSEFNYYEWNSLGRKQAAQHIKTDTRRQPKAKQELALNPEIRIVCPRGGIVLFSAAQMHSTVPNTSGKTRYSIDFRTVNAHDLRTRSGAPNLDSYPTGTSLRDFVRGEDFSAMPEDLVQQYDLGPKGEGELVFKPTEGLAKR
jgi:phytanoyl-CoA dioxygenase PhyH